MVCTESLQSYRVGPLVSLKHQMLCFCFPNAAWHFLERMRKTFPLVLISLLLEASIAMATTLVYEPYPLGTSPTGYVAGQSHLQSPNGSVQATDGTWAGSTTGTSTSYFVSSTGLQYANLAVQGGSITSSAWNTHNARAFSETDRASEVYYSFLINVSSFKGSSIFLGLANGSTYSTISGLRLDTVDSSTGKLSVYSNGVVSAVNTTISTNTTYLIVGKWAPGATSDTTTLWINPVVGEEEPIVSSLSFTAGKASGVARWYSYIGGTSTTYTSFAFDEFRVGTTWEDVTPIPEPATTAFVYLLLGGWAGRCLWKRR